MIKYTKYILIEYWRSTDELMIKFTNNIFFNLILNEYWWTNDKIYKIYFNRILSEYWWTNDKIYK